ELQDEHGGARRVRRRRQEPEQSDQAELGGENDQCPKPQTLEKKEERPEEKSRDARRILYDGETFRHRNIRVIARREMDGPARHRHRTPLDEGMRSPSRGSSAMAARSARARPLKQLSAIWCELSP